jgi:hypothetical protein
MDSRSILDTLADVLGDPLSLARMHERKKNV